MQVKYDEYSLETLRGARVVGMTTTGVARQQKLVAALNPKVRALVGKEGIGTALKEIQKGKV